MVTRENDQLPYLRSMNSCLSGVVKSGYGVAFKTAGKGICTDDAHRIYNPEEVKMMNVFRFEGESGSAGEATLYIIETTDGIKGTLVARDGRNMDAFLILFMKAVGAAGKRH